MLKNSNFAKSLLAGNIGSGDVSLDVSTGEGALFPAVGSFRAVIWGAAYQSPLLDVSREIIEMSLTSGDTFAITRAQEGTSAASWGTNDNVAHVITAGKMSEVEGFIQSGLSSFAAITGTNTYTMALDPAPTALTHGMRVFGKVNTTSTGLCTINLNGLGAKKIYYFYNGSAIQAGAGIIIGGSGLSLQYDSSLDGASGGWILLNDIIRSVSNLLTLCGDTAAVISAIGALSPTTALDALKVLTPAANKLPYFDSGATAALLTLTTISKNVLGAADASAILRLFGITGMQVMWPNGVPPIGWLECDGSSLDRTTYSNLFSVLSTAYGYADESHFYIPDWRGKFPRGWSHGTSRDPDRNTRTNRGDGTYGDHVGTNQGHELYSHRHSITNSVGGYFGLYNQVSGQVGTSFGTVYSEYSGGNETRPLNMNTMFIIKY